MVADPADLVGGKSGGTANGAVLARGVELYRSGGLAKTLASSGGSSGSGAGSAGSGSAQ
jgi:hypothetical protein